MACVFGLILFDGGDGPHGPGSNDVDVCVEEKKKLLGGRRGDELHCLACF
jgi:hypothetical protein